MPQQPKRPTASPRTPLKIPKRIDQGWATIIAALLALFGIYFAYILQRSDQAPTQPLPSSPARSDPAMQATAAPARDELDDWWHVAQYGGIADYTNENRAHCFNIHQGGNRYDAILLGTQLELPIQRPYRLDFDVESTSATSLQILVTGAASPYPLIAEQVLDIREGKSSYSYAFTTDRATRPDLTISFHLGGEDHRQICVGNIRMLQ
jgi:hypothetical protein